MLDSQRFLSDLTSWYWWATAVGVALLVNLASAYLKAPIDRWISHWSTTRQRKIEAQERTSHMHAQQLATNPSLLALEIRNEAVSILFAIFILALATVFMSAAAWFSSALPTVEPTRHVKLLTLLLVLLAIMLVVLAMRVFSRAIHHAQRISYVRRYLHKKTDG